MCVFDTCQALRETQTQNVEIHIREAKKMIHLLVKDIHHVIKNFKARFSQGCQIPNHGKSWKPMVLQVGYVG